MKKFTCAYALLFMMFYSADSMCMEPAVPSDSNAQRIIEYLAYIAQMAESTLIPHCDEIYGVPNNECTTRFGQYCKIGFGRSSVIDGSRNLARLATLVMQGILTERNAFLSLKEQLLMRCNRKKISGWSAKNKKLHVYQRKLKLAHRKDKGKLE